MHGLYGLYQCSCMRKWNSSMTSHDVTRHRMFCMYCMWQGFFPIHFDLFGTQASFVPAGRLGDTQIWNSGNNGGLSVSSWHRASQSHHETSRNWDVADTPKYAIEDYWTFICRLFLWCSMGLFSKGRRVQTKQVRSYDDYGHQRCWKRPALRWGVAGYCCGQVVNCSDEAYAACVHFLILSSRWLHYMRNKLVDLFPTEEKVRLHWAIPCEDRGWPFMLQPIDVSRFLSQFH